VDYVGIWVARKVFPRGENPPKGVGWASDPRSWGFDPKIPKDVGLDPR